VSAAASKSRSPPSVTRSHSVSAVASKSVSATLPLINRADFSGAPVASTTKTPSPSLTSGSAVPVNASSDGSSFGSLGASTAGSDSRASSDSDSSAINGTNSNASSDSRASSDSDSDVNASESDGSTFTSHTDAVSRRMVDVMDEDDTGNGGDLNNLVVNTAAAAYADGEQRSGRALRAACTVLIVGLLLWVAKLYLQHSSASNAPDYDCESSPAAPTGNMRNSRHQRRNGGNNSTPLVGNVLLTAVVIAASWSGALACSAGELLTTDCGTFYCTDYCHPCVIGKYSTAYNSRSCPLCDPGAYCAIVLLRHTVSYDNNCK
jgi:hypothetical protein